MRTAEKPRIACRPLCAERVVHASKLEASDRKNTMVPKEGMLPREQIEGESSQRVLMRRIEDSNLQDNS